MIQQVKLLSRLWLKFSHEHKLCHNFSDALKPMSDCGSKTETTNHFFLYCPFFTVNRQKLLNDLSKIDLSLSSSDKYKNNVNNYTSSYN